VVLDNFTLNFKTTPGKKYQQRKKKRQVGNIRTEQHTKAKRWDAFNGGVNGNKSFGQNGYNGNDNKSDSVFGKTKTFRQPAGVFCGQCRTLNNHEQCDYENE